MKMLTTVLVIAPLATAVPLVADAGPVDRLDRIEDRIDRRESVLDRQTDTGWLDRVEDVIDRRESLADRRGVDGLRPIDRHERRSWWRLWGGQQPF